MMVLKKYNDKTQNDLQLKYKGNRKQEMHL